MTPALRELTLPEATLTEAICLLEGSGRLEDSQAMRAGMAAADGGPLAQVAARAAALGERLGLQARLQRAGALAPWVLLGLALLVVLAGLALAGGVVDAQDRRINVMAALAALLGVHAFTFAFWLLALLWPGAGFGSLGAAAGRLWVGLTARLALGRGAEGAALLQAVLRLLERARLLPWVLGLASHTIWALSFIAALAALLFALAFRQYTLGWETTLLSPEVFTRWIAALGVLPGRLGFPVPAAGDLAARPGVALPATANSVLAWWLVGCVSVYGLLPRLLAAGACLLVWRWRRARLQPDMATPYYRKLFARFEALAPATVVDPDTHDAHGANWHLARASLAGRTQPTLAVVGFELPPELPWPPQPMPASASVVQRIAGSAAERQALLQTLAHVRPRVLILACHAASSPDRGTERLLRELLPLCGTCRLWLAAPPGAAAPEDLPPGAARWLRWLSTTGLTEVHAFTDWARASGGLPALPAAPDNGDAA